MERREVLVRTGLSGLALLLGEQYGGGQQAKPIGEIGLLKGHTDRVLSVAFSADGQRAVTCGQDGTIRLWSVANGNELCRLQSQRDPKTDDKKLVRSVVLSAD